MSTAEVERAEARAPAPRSPEPVSSRSTVPRRIPRPRPFWALQVVVDVLCYLAAAVAAVEVRLDFAPTTGALMFALAVGALMAVLQVGVGYANRLYRGRYRYGSFDEVAAVVFSAALVTVVATAGAVLAAPMGLPRSLPVATGVIAIVLMLGVRFFARWWWLRRVSRAHSESTVVVGAGESAEQLVRAMVGDASSPFHPVALLDDDPDKRHLRLYGVRVVGPIADLPDVLRRTGARSVVVAISRAESALLLQIDTVCRQARATMRVVPSASQVLGGAVTLGDIGEVTDEDLLGRRPVEVDDGAIRAVFRGRRVLITGAGGSIGSELARQVQRYDPAGLYLLDRDESALHAVSLSLDGRAQLDGDDLILADIRDPDRVAEVFARVRPDIVLHAAALKHMPLLERAPLEAWKTNVLGTRAVLDQSVRHRVQVFVNISTDKAADPGNVLGYSKRVTERLVAGAGFTTEACYLSVRFGNVLGSRGSVLTAFREQIARGGPVTVTDPEVTRYFMTVAEAVHLVLQAASLDECSGVLVLDMGEPKRIDDMARELIEKSGRDIRVEYTGLRQGEKLHESLFDPAESPRHTHHPMISHVAAQPLAAASLPDVDQDSSARDMLMALADPDSGWGRPVTSGEAVLARGSDSHEGPSALRVR